MNEKETAILFKRVFNTDDGKKLLEYMALNNGVFTASIYSDNPHRLYFKEGRRSVILEILDYCDMKLEELRVLRTNSVERYIDPRFRKGENQ